MRKRLASVAVLAIAMASCSAPRGGTGSVSTSASCDDGEETASRDDTRKSYPDDAVVSAEELRDMMDEGVTVIDVRKGVRDRLRGGRRIPAADVGKRIGEIPDTDIVIVAAGSTEASDAYDELRDSGRDMSNVGVVDDNLDGWRGAGFPTVESDPCGVYDGVSFGSAR